MEKVMAFIFLKFTLRRFFLGFNGRKIEASLCKEGGGREVILDQISSVTTIILYYFQMVR